MNSPDFKIEIGKNTIEITKSKRNSEEFSNIFDQLNCTLLSNS